ncbi:amidase domain-containing protein [Eubacteriales bacterium OttesenSCG-928-K08]|nr:amidase domain-containing protein [Eubacteriales bacterium OttesenSCG-928-K08]
MKEYDRERVLAYAHEWAFLRNPKYYDFSQIGGDCTNFASQCVLAGSGVMNYTPEHGWFYKSANNRTPSWTGVEFFNSFMLREKSSPGPFMRHVDVEEIMPGDIVQLRFSGKPAFSHCPVVVSVGKYPHPTNILVAAHTYDAYNRPLSTYVYEQVRYLHVLGVNA